jgi:hypothetical protein
VWSNRNSASAMHTAVSGIIEASNWRSIFTLPVMERAQQYVAAGGQANVFASSEWGPRCEAVGGAQARPERLLT